VGAALMFIGAALGYAEVVGLEAREIDLREGEIELRPEAGGQELVRIELGAGDSVVVELCSEDALEGGVFDSDARFEVWFVEAQARVGFRSVSDALRQGRSRDGWACMTIAHASDIPAGGTFAVRLAFTEGVDRADVEPSVASLRARAYPAAGSSGSSWFWVLFVGVSLVIGVLVRRPAPRRMGVHDAMTAAIEGDTAAVDAFLEKAPKANVIEPSPSAPTGRDLWRLALGLTLFYLAIYVVGAAPLSGRAGAVLAGLGLAAVEIALAFGLSRGALSVLALRLVQGRKRWWIVAAPLAGLIVRAAGGWLRSLVPTTGEAPIEMLISWPSGALSVAVVAAVAPVVEELFFRGFVYGWAERRLGSAGAFFLSATLFTLAHAAQTWGAWGAFASVALVGFTASGLRWASGSTLVPMVAHFVYNASIIARII